jgi:hypothetical protein
MVVWELVRSGSGWRGFLTTEDTESTEEERWTWIGVSDGFGKGLCGDLIFLNLAVSFKI